MLVMAVCPTQRVNLIGYPDLKAEACADWGLGHTAQ